MESVKRWKTKIPRNEKKKRGRKKTAVGSMPAAMGRTGKGRCVWACGGGVRGVRFVTNFVGQRKGTSREGKGKGKGGSNQKERGSQTTLLTEILLRERNEKRKRGKKGHYERGREQHDCFGKKEKEERHHARKAAKPDAAQATKGTGRELLLLFTSS